MAPNYSSQRRRRRLVTVVVLGVVAQCLESIATAMPTIHLSPQTSFIKGGESVQIEVLIENANDLRLYEIVLEVTGGTSGSLNLTDLTIDETRPDFVFAGLSPLVCLPDPANLRITCSPLSNDCVTISGPPAYLGTYTFTASSIIGGQFNVSIRDTPTTFLLNCNGTPITPFILAPGTAIVGVSIPAVSDWGMATMLLLVLIAGTVVLKRRVDSPLGQRDDDAWLKMS